MYSHKKCGIVFENWIMHNEVTGSYITSEMALVCKENALNGKGA